jgi:alkanesulfonate monooxygenase SsuD/methylene tetrahydromethanopterin reductase-like flavin-dependent oxidoreductase (luciferase family)
MVPAVRMRPTVACTSARTVALAAARGLPMLLGMHIDDAEKAAMIDLYGAGAGHVAAVVGHVADSTELAVRELKESMPRWLEPGLAGYVPVDGRPRPTRDIQKYVDFLCRVHPVGSPGRCVETMLATAERTGLRHLILMVEGTGEPARTLETIARLGAEVLPEVRRLG